MPITKVGRDITTDRVIKKTDQYDRTITISPSGCTNNIFANNIPFLLFLWSISDF